MGFLLKNLQTSVKITKKMLYLVYYPWSEAGLLTLSDFSDISAKKVIFHFSLPILKWIFQFFIDFSNIFSFSKRNEMPVKENNVKMKALHETILRMNEKNLRLTSENKTLKQDLEKMLEQSAKAKDTQSKVLPC